MLGPDFGKSATKLLVLLVERREGGNIYLQSGPPSPSRWSETCGQKWWTCHLRQGRPGRAATDFTLVTPARLQAHVGQDHLGWAGVVVHSDPGQQEDCDCRFICNVIHSNDRKEESSLLLCIVCWINICPPYLSLMDIILICQVEILIGVLSPVGRNL